MVDSLQPGFSVTGPCDGRSAVLFTSPHSGRDYPATFLAAARLPEAQLRRAEDRHVDRLLDGIDDAPVMRARFARTFLDLNRAADEIDLAMIGGILPVPTRRTDRVVAGLGVLPRIAAHGQEIYRAPIDPTDAMARIAAIHTPWYARIATLIARARARHGHAILIECHSMPTPSGIRPPQIVLGDRHGLTAAPALVRLVERHFASFGWRVTRNTPYAGGHITEAHGAVGNGVHAIQIEIDRVLYMDTETLQRGAGFDRVAGAMTGLARVVAAAAPGLPLAATLREAAE